MRAGQVSSDLLITSQCQGSGQVMVYDWCGYLLPAHKIIYLFPCFEISNQIKKGTYGRLRKPSQTEMLLKGWEVFTIKWMKNISRNRLMVSAVQAGQGCFVHNKRPLLPILDTKTKGKLIIIQTMKVTYYGKVTLSWQKNKRKQRTN